VKSIPSRIVPDEDIEEISKQGVAEGLEDNGISFKVQKGKNKFATTLSVGSNPVGVYQYDATTGRSIAEVYPEFKGKGLGKLLVLHAIYTAAKLGLDFQEDESRTSEYDNVLDSLSSNGYIIDDDGYWYVTGEGEQYLQQSIKQGVAEGVPQPGPSSGAPKQFGPDAKIQTRKMTVGQIISSIPGVPYYNNVVDDWDAKDYHSWNVTEKVIEYAEYFKKHPESLAQLKPIIVLNGKFEDGAHRVSAIWLLQQRMDPKNPLWANFKLNVQFVKQDVTEDELEEDWRSALATGAMAGAMAMGANAKAPQMVHQLVEPGDTVYSIARQNNVNPLEIYKLNNMGRNTKLEIGQKVLVPDYSKPVSKMPATVKPTVKQEPAKVAQPAQSFKDKLASMIPKFSNDEEDGVILLSNNSDAEAALQTAAKAAGLKGVELAQFMAQTRHESWDFSKMKEVGNKKKFDRYEKNRSLAKQLGNKVKGDGELFKGRGPMQLTGRDNYTKASQQIFGDDRLVKNPDLVSNSLEVGAKVALWYWKNRVRPKVDDFNNTVQVVKAINANEPKHVVQQRHTKFKEYLAVL
jgi:putative chitinase